MGAETKIPSALEFLLKSIDFFPDPAFVINCSGEVIGWNSAIEELSHVKRADILGTRGYTYAEPFFGDRSPDLVDFLFNEFDEIYRKYVNVKVEKGIASGETYASQVRGGRGAWLWAKATLVYEPGTGEPVGALQCFRDISHHKSLETKLRMAEAISKDTADFFDNVVQGANVWISFSDSHGAVLLWNDFAERLSGFSAGEVIGQNSLKLIYPDEAYRKKVEEKISRSLDEEGMVRNFTTTVTPKNGKERILSWNITPLPDGTGGELGQLEVGVDLTEIYEAHEKVNQALEAARENEFRFRTIFETAADLIMIVDASGVIKSCNKRITSLLGFSAEELEGESLDKLIYPYDVPGTYRLLEYTYRLGSRYNEEYRFLNAKNELVDVEISAAVLDGKDGRNVLMLIRDVTERKKAQQQLKYLTLHDPMTGLYNRRYFEEELRRLNFRRHAPISIISCDVDGLKQINDRFGHRKGDEIIKAAASVIKKPFRSCDVVARIGGDEFAVILPRTNAEVAERARNRILDAVDAYNAKQPEIPLSISVGVATSEREVSLEKLFHESDNAMYEHKARHRINVRSI
ncbi:MAG: PAS domain S-box protein [Bacillota bacterium]